MDLDNILFESDIVESALGKGNKVIEEGSVLFVNKMVSDAISIPAGEYMVFINGESKCVLIPTSDNIVENSVEVSSPAIRRYSNSIVVGNALGGEGTNEVINEGTIDEGIKYTDTAVVQGIKYHLTKSGGRLKRPLSSGKITMANIASAIRNERCLRLDDRDLGNTYLEQMVGQAVRKVVRQNDWELERINDARQLFGMAKLSKKELLRTERKREATLRNKRSDRTVDMRARARS